jgi:isoquinoline 1-oxidoreductase beta subunit
VHESFSSYSAHVVEISIADGVPRVHRVVAAVDCGTAINPDVVRAQAEGCIGMGLGAILAEQVTLTGGAVDQGNYGSYTPLRIDAMPAVEVHIVPSTEPPTGVGEPALPPIGPAVGNAVFAATGKMHRVLPMVKS